MTSSSASALGKKLDNTSVPPSNFQYWKNPQDAAGKPTSNFTPQMLGYQMQPGMMTDGDKMMQQSRSISSLMGQDQLGLSQSAAASGSALAAGNRTASGLEQQKQSIGLGQTGTMSAGNITPGGQSFNAFGQPINNTTTEKYANVDIMGRSYAEIAREKNAERQTQIAASNQRSLSNLEASNQMRLQDAQLRAQQALAATEAQKARDVAGIQAQGQMASSLFSSLNIGGGGSNFRYW